MTSKLHGLMERHASFPKRWLKAYLEPLNTRHTVAVIFDPQSEHDEGVLAGVLAEILGEPLRSLIKEHGIQIMGDKGSVVILGAVPLQPSVPMFAAWVLLALLDLISDIQVSINFPETVHAEPSPDKFDDPFWVEDGDQDPASQRN